MGLVVLGNGMMGDEGNGYRLDIHLHKKQTKKAGCCAGALNGNVGTCLL